MREAVLKENRHIPKAELINRLKETLQLEHHWLIPWQPHDSSRHSDGMARFLKGKRLLVANYENESDSWRLKYSWALEKTGFIDEPFCRCISIRGNFTFGVQSQIIIKAYERRKYILLYIRPTAT